MKLKKDFYNNLQKEIRETYFPDVKYYRDNENTTKIQYAGECFSNGVLTYTKLINTLSKNCNETKANMHAIVSKYVEDFEGYEYKPK